MIDGCCNGRSMSLAHPPEVQIPGQHPCQRATMASQFSSGMELVMEDGQCQWVIVGLHDRTGVRSQLVNFGADTSVPSAPLRTVEHEI